MQTSTLGGTCLCITSFQLAPAANQSSAVHRTRRPLSSHTLLRAFLRPSSKFISTFTHDVPYLHPFHRIRCDLFLDATTFSTVAKRKLTFILDVFTLVFSVLATQIELRVEAISSLGRLSCVSACTYKPFLWVPVLTCALFWFSALNGRKKKKPQKAPPPSRTLGL